ncbi:MAG: hypothetical protein AVO39_00525 [delta proteobacterium MLS_D]|nr:MAG: hypothetical protein AVO39_00525 [delta proteobacterium MLS_D]
MNRYHGIELSERHWFPSSLFGESVEFLGYFENISNIFSTVAPLLRHALDRSGTSAVIDLCSGGGGPWPRLAREMKRQNGLCPSVLLTDKNPEAGLLRNCRIFSSNGDTIACSSQPIDARNVPADLDGVLTFFNAFHHFSPREAHDILGNAVSTGRGIAVFEATERSLFSIIQMIFTLPPLVWVLTPFLRPVRFSRIFFTYVVPILPLVITLDGVLSSLRTYTPEELRRFAGNCDGTVYTWRAGSIKSFRLPRKITYLIGYPLHRVKKDGLHSKADPHPTNTKKTCYEKGVG